MCSPSESAREGEEQDPKTSRNEQSHLVVRTSEEVLIPIKKHYEYLGTVLAYRDLQTLTLQHRLGKAKGQYALLRKTLHARRLCPVV